MAVVLVQQGTTNSQISHSIDSTQEAQVRALGEQLLKEDFEGLADEGEVRYSKSIYSKEHMMKERALGPTGIQLRSARPVDVSVFYLVSSWKINKVEVSNKRGLMVVEFDRLLSVKHNKAKGGFEYRKDNMNHEVVVIKMIFNKGQWYIDCPPDLHISAKVYRHRMVSNIELQERLLAKEIDENSKTGKLDETIQARKKRLNMLITDAEALNLALDSSMNSK
jgi:hypothetical protein